MNPVVDALRKREQATRDVVIRAMPAGEYVQVRVSDRYMKLTRAEARQLVDAVTAVLDGDAGE